jgi:hypothetical protein
VPIHTQTNHGTTRVADGFAVHGSLRALPLDPCGKRVAPTGIKGRPPYQHLGAGGFEQVLGQAQLLAALLQQLRSLVQQLHLREQRRQPRLPPVKRDKTGSSQFNSDFNTVLETQQGFQKGPQNSQGISKGSFKIHRGFQKV